MGAKAMVDESLSARLEAYFAEFRGAFRRRDQAQWALVYLRGLLEGIGRKNVESLSRAVDLPDGQRVEDMAQALGHFLNHSPWDEAALWRRHQQRLASEVVTGTFVLEEMAFVKQGRHSVGVQRQFSRALGCKTNCQLAVCLHHVHEMACVPLALRLYLPKIWIANEPRLTSAGVPPEARQLRSRLELGLELLDAARAAGVPGLDLAVGPGWQWSEEFAEASRQRGLLATEVLPTSQEQAVQECRRRLFEELGLDQFEGRSWRGFHHHACMVMLAARLE